jgi:putative endonuclease
MEYYVYIVASRSRVLYVGMTNDLERRVFDHKAKRMPGFTARYNVTRLVYYQSFPSPWQAIEAEKKIKGWTRAKKIALIESMNKEWRDLAEDWRSPAPNVNTRSATARQVPPPPARQMSSPSTAGHSERSEESPRSNGLDPSLRGVPLRSG